MNDMILKKKYDEFINLFCKRDTRKGNECDVAQNNDTNTTTVIYDNYSDAIKYGIETLNKFVHLIEDLKQQKWYIESFTTIPELINKFEKLLNTENPNLNQLIQYKYECESIFSINTSYKNEMNKSYSAASNQIISNNNEIDHNVIILNKLQEEVINITNEVENKISELNNDKNRKIKELSDEMQDKIHKLESEFANKTLEIEQNTGNIIKQFKTSLKNKENILSNNIQNLTNKNQLITKINMIFNNFMECNIGKEFKQYLKYTSTLNILFQKALSIIDYNNKLLNEDRERSKNNKKFNRDILNDNNMDSSSKDNNTKSNDEDKNGDYLYSNNTNTIMDSTNNLVETSKNNIQEANMYCRNTLNNNNKDKSYLYCEDNNTDIICDNIIEINCDTSNENRVQYNKSDLKYNIEGYISNMRKKNAKLHEDNMDGILNNNRHESFYNNGTKNNDEVA